MAKHIIGINLNIIDPLTDAEVNFHTITDVNFSIANKTTNLTIASYTHERTYIRGGKPAGDGKMITLYDVPPLGECFYKWAYQKLVAPIEPNTTNVYGQLITPNEFTGAALVEREVKTDNTIVAA